MNPVQLPADDILKPRTRSEADRGRIAHYHVPSALSGSAQRQKETGFFPAPDKQTLRFWLAPEEGAQGCGGTSQDSRTDRRAIPVAVRASAHVSDSLAEDVKDFALRNAPDVGVGVIDTGGFRRFTGHGLEVLNADRSHVIETRRTLPEVATPFEQPGQPGI